MSCERFRPALATHAGGAPIDEATSRHLDGCAACRQSVDTQTRILAELDAELGRSLAISASPDFAARVVRGARNAGAAPATRRIPAPTWAGLGMAAAIVLAVLIRQPGLVDSSSAADVRLKAEATRPREEALAPDVRPKSEATARALARSPAPTFPRSRVPGLRRSRVPLASPDPPVIVEPSRALAIQRLRELNANGRLDGNVLPLAATPETAFADLTIAPLEVAAIEVMDVEIVSRSPAVPNERQ